MNENMNPLAVVQVKVKKVFSVFIKILFYLFVNFNLNIT